jgi:hypothetical protein
VQELQVGVESAIAVPTGATVLNIIHEWGDVVLEDEVVSSPGDYDFTPDSVGVHRFIWSNGATTISTQFFGVFMQVISLDDFTAAFAGFDTITEDEFAIMERTARHTIQNYTGRIFGPYVAKTLRIEGDGGDSMYLPERVTDIAAVTDEYGTDVTTQVEIAPQTDNIIQKASTFRGGYEYEVKRDVFWHRYQLFREGKTFNILGNFGYEYIPVEVGLAAGLLLRDAIGEDDVSALRARGVFEAQMGDFSLRLNADQWGTTGNIQADNMLSPYVNMGIGLV